MSSARSRSGRVWMRNDIQAKIQVLAKPPGGHVLLQIAIRGRQHANINQCSYRHLPTGITTRSCRTRKSLACNSRSNSPISSRQNRTALGCTETSHGVVRRAGKRPLEVPEHMAGEQRARDQRAINRDEPMHEIAGSGYGWPWQ